MSLQGKRSIILRVSLNHIFSFLSLVTNYFWHRIQHMLHQPVQAAWLRTSVVDDEDGLLFFMT